MAEAFVKTFKRDYARVSAKPDAASVLRQLDSWFEHYNRMHPHKALGYRSPREFRANGGEDNRERGRRWASTAWKHNGHGGGRVKAAAAAGGGAPRQP